MCKTKIRLQIKPILLASLGSLVALLPVWGQALPPKARRTEPLEKYDNPPAYIFRIETSAGMVSQYGPFTSYQVNVDAGGHNILGDAANEPSICVDPTNANRMAIGWRQFDSISSNFRQAGYGYTTDGGMTWRFPGVLENNVFRSDPVLNSDNAGNFFYLSLLQTFFDDLWHSLNGGQSWTRLGPATGGDKEWFTIDRTNGVGHGFQYQFWSTDGNNYGGRQFSRSTDGGVTWMNPIDIPNHPVWGTLDVDANGNLFIGGGDQGSQFWCIRSSNAQNGGLIPTFDQVTAVNLGGSIVSSGLINSGGLAGQIFLAVDRSGSATNNNIYMLASVQPTGATSGTDVMFVRSTDGGRSFSAPHRINDDPINQSKWHWFGAFSVAPNGRLDAVWLDTRNAANNTDSQLFYSNSTDGGDTWSSNIALSNSFNPFVGYPNQNKIGDYITIVSDNTGSNVAYAATFNGEEDVYYLRVPANPGSEGDLGNGNTAEGTASLASLTSGSYNTAMGLQALFNNTTGDSNTGTGVNALYNNTGGAFNAANGGFALFSNTTGNSNTGTGVNALVNNTTASDNTAMGYQSLFSNTTGGSNTGTGVNALYSNTTGVSNTATGVGALFSNTTATFNTATGVAALFTNTTGNDNTATGTAALYHNTIGGLNTANGFQALFSNTSGGANTANGVNALFNNATANNNTADGVGALANNTTGSNNIGLGTNAGGNLTTGNNIDIYDPGVAGESNTIRIGTKNVQTATFIAGISGATASGGAAVFVDANGQLGTATSSRRFKQEIKPMDKASEAILALRPVTFRYKQEIDPKGIPQFGLVAEEVEKVNPDLVVRDAEGKVYTVRYEAVNAMLLNEFLKEHREVEQLNATVSENSTDIKTLAASLKGQASQIQKLSAQVATVSPRPVTPVADNNQ